jgi:uncharacterized protein YbaR (Trm112 family)
MDAPKTPYVVMTVSCPDCQQKQVLEVRARAGFGVMSEQSITCVRCKKDFPVMLPDKIVGGPSLPSEAVNAHLDLPAEPATR